MGTGSDKHLSGMHAIHNETQQNASQEATVLHEGKFAT
jgi:hypothetical protein